MIKAGLIGGRLSHSLSPQIHQKYWSLTGLSGHYSLLETPDKQLNERLSELEAEGFTGVNITIPHKTAVMRCLDALSAEAQAIGAVNTVHFYEGRRIGHNTDHFGLKSLLARNDFSLCGSRVVILGSGGAARCALCLARHEVAREVIVVSRDPQNADAALGAVGYDALKTLHSIDLLINATPVGMYPQTDACPVSDDVIEKCAHVADMIYNPAATQLLQKAARLGKPHANGLWMLCAQALQSQQIWTGLSFDETLCAKVYNHLKIREYRNIVLIGMPGSGKTTIGCSLAVRLGLKFADTDAIIENRHGPIPQIFAQQGEAAFRDVERETAIEAAARSRTVIATGGGIVQTRAAMNALEQTGVVVYIDRPLETLLADVKTENRPLLADGREKLTALYRKRSALYRRYADITVENGADAESCVAQILKKLEEI